jgi:thiamine biosynthesis lipoprotein
MGSDVVAVFDGPHTLSGNAESQLRGLEQIWSRFIPDSDVSTLNRDGGWQSVHADTVLLFQRAADAWEVTNGAFDPTVLPSLVANGYGRSRSEHQGETVLSGPPSRGPAPGMARIDIDAAHAKIHFPEGLGFDPGGIGKGLAADIVAEALVTSGATAAMVAVGGDVRVAGTAPSSWTVEVESPFDRNETIAVLSLVDGAVCTSSVQAKTWQRDGEMTHHLIDPTTGRPTSSSIVSATVITGQAWMAEAMCKAAIVTEPLDAIAFCRSRGVEAIIVDVAGVVWTTDGAARFAA